MATSYNLLDFPEACDVPSLGVDGTGVDDPRLLLLQPRLNPLVLVMVV